MDGFWLLFGAGGIAFYLWHRSSKRESPPDWGVAPPVPPVGDESPITEDEWRYFNKVVRAPMVVPDAAKKHGVVPYVEPYTTGIEGATPEYYVRRWNSRTLIQWRGASHPDWRPNPRRIYYPLGVSANLWTPEIRVWDGTSTSDLKASKVVRGQGPWNAELRGMMKAIEAMLKKPVV